MLSCSFAVQSCRQAVCSPAYLFVLEWVAGDGICLLSNYQLLHNACDPRR